MNTDLTRDNEYGKETDHAPLDMPEELGEKIIVTI